MRRTKIVCTLGPASNDVDTLLDMISAGMDVARFNFSHGTHEEQRGLLQKLQEARKGSNRLVATMLDTKGPEIRLGQFKGGKVFLERGATFVLTTRDILGDAKRVSVSYEKLPQVLQAEDLVFIDDGNVVLQVKEVSELEVVCTVNHGGLLSDRKTVNLPGIAVDLPSITLKDEADIAFAIENNFDYIAVSFVRSAEDVLAMRALLESQNADIKIISKIENQQGVENLHRILQVSDGIMVARGDLGVEIPAEEVPMIQKKMIAMCNDVGKPVITATQMLDSMIRNPRPTRAEASDVANAILDGTDAIMLSGETAAGLFPVASVQMMSRIALQVEGDEQFQRLLSHTTNDKQTHVTEAIGQAVSRMATDLGVAAIITPTQSGYTARMISKFNPAPYIVAVTPQMSIARQLQLVKGVFPVIGSDAIDTDGLLEDAVGAALEARLVNNGDLVIITGGVPVGTPGTTNLIKVHIIGRVVGQGLGIGKRAVTGKAYLLDKAAQMHSIPPGSILVAESTDSTTVEAIGDAVGVITEEGGLTSHAAIVCLNLHKPVIVGVKNITQLLSTGDVLTLDSERGLIYLGKTKIL